MVDKPATHLTKSIRTPGYSKQQQTHSVVIHCGSMAGSSSSSSSTSSAYPIQVRQATSSLCTPPSLLAQFTSPLPSRLYSRQYAALYDFRLRKLRRGRLLAKAKAKWQDTEESTGGEGKPTYTERILEVKRGKVTYITGIVYTEMRLKPDVLQDLTREVSREDDALQVGEPS